jgi:hypothetical protein
MLHSYYGSLGKIVIAERPLMTEFIDDLSRVIKPGLESLNWNSLGIPEFIKNTEQVDSSDINLLIVSKGN